MGFKSAVLAKIFSLFLKGKRKWVVLGAAAVASLLATMGIGGDLAIELANTLANTACAE